MKIQSLIEKYVPHMEFRGAFGCRLSQGAALLASAEIVASVPPSTELTTPTISRLPRPLMPNTSYRMTHLINHIDPSALVLEAEDGSHICLAVEDFMNAFSDNEIVSLEAVEA